MRRATTLLAETEVTPHDTGFITRHLRRQAWRDRGQVYHEFRLVDGERGLGTAFGVLPSGR